MSGLSLGIGSRRHHGAETQRRNAPTANPSAFRVLQCPVGPRFSRRACTEARRQWKDLGWVLEPALLPNALC